MAILGATEVKELAFVRADALRAGDEIRTGYRHRSVWGTVVKNHAGHVTLFDPWYDGPLTINDKPQGTFEYRYHPMCLVMVWR